MIIIVIIINTISIMIITWDMRTVRLSSSTRLILSARGAGTRTWGLGDLAASLLLSPPRTHTLASESRRPYEAVSQS